MKWSKKNDFRRTGEYPDAVVCDECSLKGLSSGSASVQGESLGKLHHHWSTFIRIRVEVPTEFLGQMDFKFFSSFP